MRGAAAAADGAATAVEEPQPYAVTVGHVAQPALGAVDLPLRGGDAAELGGVGVAEHDLLDIAPQRDQAPVGRVREHVLQDRVGGLELVGGLQQRHDADLRPAGVQIDQPGLARQHGGREDVVGALAHRDDVRLDHLGPEDLQRPLDGLEDPEGLLAGRVHRRRGGREGTAGPELLGEQLGPVVARHVGVPPGLLAEPVEELAEGVVVGVGVLADVHRGELEAEGGQRADRAVHPAVGEQSAAVLAQRGLDQREVGQQLAGAQVVVALLVRDAPGQARLGVLQLLPDAGGLEPVRLLGVQPLVAGADLRQALQVRRQRVQQLLGGAGVADGVRQEAAQLVDHLQGVVDAVLVLEDQHVPGDLRGDVGVAVAVAADPGAEGERPGVVRELHADPLQLGGEVLQDVADGARVQLVQVVDGVARLVGGLGTHHAQLVGLPDEVDVLRQTGVVAPAVGLDDRGLQKRRDAPELVQHRPARGLGGVGGEDRADVEVLDRGAQVLGVGVLEPVGRTGEQSALGGPLGAQLAAAVHLLGDVGEVEVGGEGADQLGRGVEFGAAQQLGGGLAVLAGQSAHPLDQLEKVWTLLPDEGLAEEITQAPDVGAQLAAGRRGARSQVVGTAHRCGSLQC